MNHTLGTVALLLFATSVGAACARDQGAVDGATPTAASPGAVTATPPPDETATPPTTPSPVEPEHGGTYWGVYLAVGEEPDLEDAIAYLTEERGIELFSIGDISCDAGAREALGKAAGPQRVALYFETEDDARAWAETLPAPPVGVAEVQTYCLD